MRQPGQHEPSPVETAISQLTNVLIPNAVADVFERHGVQKQITVDQFKRLIVLYFHEKTLREWCEAVGVPASAVEGHNDAD